MVRCGTAHESAAVAGSTFQRLVEIVDDVLRRLDADRHPDERLGNTAPLEIFLGQTGV